MADPAAVYCTDLGYGYGKVAGPSGERGECVFPDGERCDAWAFLEGQCGQQHSYCARNRFRIVTHHDGADPFSADYAVCVSYAGVEIGPVTELTDLSTKTEHAGCATGEQPATASLTSGFPEPEMWAEVRERAVGAPSSFDWRNNGGDWLTSVKDQGGCGSCWAFAAVGAVEAGHNISAGNLNLDLDLSEQYLVSGCSGAGSCCGGSGTTALEYIRLSGIPDDACMPYVDGSGCSCGLTCNADCTYRTGGACSDRTCGNRCTDWATRLTRIFTWGSVAQDPATIRQRLVDQGPLVVSIGIGAGYGGYWDGDVYRCTNDTDSNHAVLITGYDDAGQYWIVKNSWGTGWGTEGYFKMGYGECHIEQHVSYVIAAVPPVPHDDFVDAGPLGPLPASVGQTTVGATVEAGEPQPACGTISATVWFGYTPPINMQLTADTTGSDFDTILAVYTGTTLATLTRVACDDDSGPGLQSQLAFAAAAGSTYWFQVGGWAGASGNLALHLTGPLPVVSVSSVSGVEGAGPLWFPVSLNVASEQTVSVAFTTADGSAVAGADYVGASGVVTFLPGDTSETVPITLVDDGIDEPDESFTLMLSDPVNATIEVATGTGTILNDDDVSAPIVTVPGAMTVQAAGPGGAVVAFAASATDPPHPAPPVTCLPPSGSVFPVGTATVTCSASDAAGNLGTGSFTITVNPLLEMSLRSVGAFDGWVLEQDEYSGRGGTFDSTGTTARLGDDALDQQYRSILHFDTADLPDNAVITGVTLRIKKQSIVGGSPFSTHDYLTVDMKTGAFHDFLDLEKVDFQAVGSRGNVGRFIKTAALGWYRAPLRAVSYPLVSLTGTTQFRLRFSIDDNDDLGADYLSFYTGDAAEADRPQLIVTYYVP